MHQDVLPALTLLASSPELKEEDRSIVALFIALANEKTCDLTMLELLQYSQADGEAGSTFYHFKHPLADVLAREFVGWIAIHCTTFEGEDVWFDGDTYNVKRNGIEIIWTPARYVRQHLLRQEQRRRELHAELDAA